MLVPGSAGTVRGTPGHRAPSLDNCARASSAGPALFRRPLQAFAATVVLVRGSVLGLAFGGDVRGGAKGPRVLTGVGAPLLPGALEGIGPQGRGPQSEPGAGRGSKGGELEAGAGGGKRLELRPGPTPARASSEPHFSCLFKRGIGVQ